MQALPGLARATERLFLTPPYQHVHRPSIATCDDGLHAISAAPAASASPVSKKFIGIPRLSFMNECIKHYTPCTKTSSYASQTESFTCHLSRKHPMNWQRGACTSYPAAGIYLPPALAVGAVQPDGHGGRVCAWLAPRWDEGSGYPT